MDRSLAVVLRAQILQQARSSTYDELIAICCCQQGTSMKSTNEAGPHSYTVLYYKRKVSKVHKSKGVSKMDGTLTIFPSPKASVVLKDGNNTVYSGSIVDVAKRVDSLREEEIISVGNYEVEICDRIGGKPFTSIGAATPGIATNSHLARSSKGLRRPLHPTSRPPIAAKSSFNNLLRGTLLKQPLVNGRRLVRPAQPKPKRPPSEALDDDESDNDVKPKMKENTKYLPLKRGLPYFKSVGSTVTNVRRKIRRLAPASKTNTDAPNIFVDAVGSPDVPHSIRSVLKPHQIIGVSFLWNCLTGSGRAAEASPHVSDDHFFKGAILADGKLTLAMKVKIFFLV